MDSIFNLVIILIPLAIFVSRIVMQARSKHAPPPPQPRIPVHFEDDDEHEGQKARAAYAQAMPRKEKTLKPKGNAFGTARSAKTPPDRGISEAPSQDQSSFLSNLSHLSAMKQAVVMAEVLGPPKALRE